METDDELVHGQEKAYIPGPASSTQPSSHDLEKSTTQPDLEAGRVPAATKVVTAQDWTGPTDPENPMNWTTPKKVYHISMVALMGFTVTFGSSVYTPGIPGVMERFGVSRTAAILGLSLWTLGLSCGPMIAAPISETFGRNIVYRLSLPVCLLFTMGAGFSQNFGSLLVLRFLGGLTGSPVLAVGAGTNADLYPPRWRAYPTSAFLVAPFLGPALGPIVGGFAAEFKSWRWTQWCILFAGAVILLGSLGMQETYKKIILQRRAKRLAIAPPQASQMKGAAALKFIFTVTLLRPLYMLVREPIVLFFSMYTAFTFALLFAFFEALPLIFTEVYGFTTYQNGLVFVSVGLGVLLAWLTSVLIDWNVYQKKYREVVAAGRLHVAPEHRLYSAMAGSIGISVGVFWLAWTSRSSVHWIVPTLAAMPFAWGNLCIFTSSALYLVDVYGPLNGASAVAANGLLRYALGAAFPLFIIQMYERLGIPWATSLLGFLSLLMLPIPWVFYRFGAQVRQKSAFDTMKA